MHKSVSMTLPFPPAAPREPPGVRLPPLLQGEGGRGVRLPSPLTPGALPEPLGVGLPLLLQGEGGRGVRLPSPLTPAAPPSAPAILPPPSSHRASRYTHLGTLERRRAGPGCCREAPQGPSASCHERKLVGQAPKPRPELRRSVREPRVGPLCRPFGALAAFLDRDPRASARGNRRSPASRAERPMQPRSAPQDVCKA